MLKRLLEAIKTYDTIIIHRHFEPDLDALGAQLGLKGLIDENYENKMVYVVGDENEYRYIGSMDTIEDSVYKGALAIVLDVAVKNRVSDQRFMLADEVFVVDHHQNATDFVKADNFYSLPDNIATCQIIALVAMQEKMEVSSQTATYIMSGLITDSGRFMYPLTNETTFECAAFLMRKGADIQYIYDHLYIEDLAFKKLKGHFINHFQTTPNKVAYMKNDKTLKDEYNVSTFTISRGMVNTMSGIKGIPMWVNFTEEDDGSIICELRSKDIPVVGVAKKYGGGGHNLACGCTVHSWEETDLILNDLDALLERSA